jgi:hypothetical protein
MTKRGEGLQCVVATQRRKRNKENKKKDIRRKGEK